MNSDCEKLLIREHKLNQQKFSKINKQYSNYLRCATLNKPRCIGCNECENLIFLCIQKSHKKNGIKKKNEIKFSKIRFRIP